jgi:tetratricopeptide (TPR) repeat protein
LAWLYSAWAKVWLGEPEAAIERVTQAIRLSPADRFLFGMYTAKAWAHFVAASYKEAFSWAAKAVQEQPTYLPALRILAASKALMGCVGQAREVILQVREADPALRVSNLKYLVPLRRLEDLARYEEGLRKAGLPE